MIFSLNYGFLLEFGIDRHFGSEKSSLFGLLGFGGNKPSPYSDCVPGLYLAIWRLNCIIVPVGESVASVYANCVVFRSGIHYLEFCFAFGSVGNRTTYLDSRTAA